MPHCFVIELKEELAITKYCLFTGHEWLPKEPTILGGSVARALLDAVHFGGFFGTNGGAEEFLKREFNLTPSLLLAESKTTQRKLQTEVILVPPNIILYSVCESSL